MKDKRLISIFLLLLASFVWGVSFSIIKYVLGYITFFQLLLLRFGFPSVIGLFIVIRYRKFLKERKTVFLLILLGLSLFVSYVFQTAGLEFTTPSKSAFITGLYVVLTPLFSAAIFKKKIHKNVVFALILSLIGLIFLSQINLKSLSTINLGDLLTFLCSIAFAFQIILKEMLVVDVPSLMVTSFQLIVAFILTIPFAASNGSMNLTVSVLLLTVFLGIVASFLATQAESFALQYVNSTEASLIFVLEPAFAYLSSFIFFREVLYLNSVIGAILVVSAMIIVAIDNKS
jgi:drug/metabolite transporter (DMT)-like permease